MFVLQNSTSGGVGVRILKNMFTYQSASGPDAYQLFRIVYRKNPIVLVIFKEEIARDELKNQISLGFPIGTDRLQKWFLKEKLRVDLPTTNREFGGISGRGGVGTEEIGRGIIRQENPE